MKQRAHARLLNEARTPIDADQVTAAVLREGPLLAPAAREALVAELLADISGLGPLESLLADDAVTDVLVNGGGDVWVERHGRLHRAGITLTEPVVLRLIERIVAPLGLRADRSAPVVDARLADGSRVHAVLPPLAVDGPCLTIRRFRARPVPLEAFAVPEVASLLVEAVTSHRNMVVSGGTGAGKTTLLNALAGHIPAGERIVTVEDTAELRLPQEHVVRLEARVANAEGSGGVSVRDLVRAALRMRPDRIVVGECRGGEALDMLQAMNTGHEGSLTTCHANGPADALRRLETMALLSGVALPHEAVREQLLAAVELVVQVARRPDGARVVVEVLEVQPRLEGRLAVQTLWRDRP